MLVHLIRVGKRAMPELNLPRATMTNRQRRQDTLHGPQAIILHETASFDSRPSNDPLITSTPLSGWLQIDPSHPIASTHRFLR